jgi:hypothetical protein
MKLANHQRAIVDVAKLLDYCLNPVHPLGKHKARVFRAALDLTAKDAEELRNKLLQTAMLMEATIGASDEYGTRYIIEFDWVRKDNKATIRSSWIVEAAEAAPRFLTCFVKR